MERLCGGHFVQFHGACNLDTAAISSRSVKYPAFGLITSKLKKELMLIEIFAICIWVAG